jgi:hypothetical protein
MPKAQVESVTTEDAPVEDVVTEDAPVVEDTTLTADPDVDNVVETVEGDNGAENLPVDYDTMHLVPTAFSNPPAE